jgi:hypothetical protein
MSEGLGQYVRSFNRSDFIVTLVNGSQIIFFAESFDTDKDHNRFKGLEVNGFGIDEINEMQESTFNKCIERAGSWQGSKGCPIKILATCNPAKNWVKKQFYDRWVKNNLPNGWAYIPSKITDNPHIDSAYVESLKMLPAHEYEVFVNGNWEIERRSGAEFFKHFRLETHVCKVEWVPGDAILLSFDENVNPYITCLVFQVRKEGEMKVYTQIDEICLPDPLNRVNYVCREFARRYPLHSVPKLFIYGDATSQKEDTKKEKGENFFTEIIKHLQDYRPVKMVPKSNPAVITSGIFVDDILAGHIENLRIDIGENCLKSVHDYSHTKEDSDGTILKKMVKNPDTGVSYQEHGHQVDALRYLLVHAESSEYYKSKTGATRPNALIHKLRIMDSKSSY